MKKVLRNKVLLTAIIGCLFTLFITLPPAVGYGTSTATATVITNGTTTEPMYTTEYAYYKICCNPGDTLSVTLTHYTGYDLDLKLYDISGTLLDSSSSSTIDDVCSTSPSTKAWIIIRVSNYENIVPSTINLIITGATGSGCIDPPRIPGFEVLPTLFGMLAATFLAVILLKKRKEILN